ncbi:hypothetical protein FOV72_09215 [Gordonia rubripertincta]|nr:hypothetical protein FOV72_09215 [Gordonia rubripertincta]
MTLTGVLVVFLAAFAVCALVGLSIWLIVLFGLLSGVQAVAWVTEQTSAWRLPAEPDTSR